MFDLNLSDLAVKQRQQDILDQASRDHRARLARRSRPRSGGLSAQLLGGLGGMLIVLGYRLQSRYLKRKACAGPLG
jgi:hypothetical protein